MIPRVSIPQQAPAPTSVRARASALLKDMLDAWLAHHQRLVDLGTNRFL